MADDERQTAIEEYKSWLAALGADARADFVDAARRNEDWSQPTTAYLATHARKWGLGRRAEAYAQWAFEIKNRPGVQVYAYIHPVHGNRGLAFVDVDQGAIVQFDCDTNLNYDCITPSNGARQWAADKVAIGTHWRLRDTER